MITNGFTYVAVLLFMAAVLVTLEKKSNWKFFELIPAVVCVYLAAMLLCTLKVWDMSSTKPAYNALKNPFTYAMIFSMLLHCDIRKIIKLGPKMLIGFFSASITIMVGFIVAYLLMKGFIGAVTPLGKVSGSREVSNLLLYSVIALLASRASLLELADAPAWILTGFIILAIHALLMLALCKVFKIDLFTGAVASLANIGGTASAPVLAGSYSGSLVPVGILMALLGYVVGTPCGIMVAHIMQKLAG